MLLIRILIKVIHFLLSEKEIKLVIYYYY